MNRSFQFKNARFATTATRLKEYPTLRDLHGEKLPEIAVVGRSNVGKSSLLNHLFLSKNLVHTSATPGKTQALNFFVLNDSLAFVDLPGYGYAQVPLQLRKKWGPMIEEYFTKREEFKLTLFLFDIRRTPNEEDITLLTWMSQQGQTILVLTKVDKLTVRERHKRSKEILGEFNLSLPHVQYSTLKNIGRKELIHLINEAFKEHHGTH